MNFCSKNQKPAAKFKTRLSAAGCRTGLHREHSWLHAFSIFYTTGTEMSGSCHPGHPLLQNRHTYTAGRKILFYVWLRRRSWSSDLSILKKEFGSIYKNKAGSIKLHFCFDCRLG